MVNKIYKILNVVSKKCISIQVLQRKTEEAAMATKRLKELLEARKSSARENSGMRYLFVYIVSYCHFHFRIFYLIPILHLSSDNQREWN